MEWSKNSLHACVEYLCTKTLKELDNRSLSHSLILDKFIEKPRRLKLYSDNLAIFQYAIVFHNMTLLIILCGKWILCPNLTYSERRNPVESLVEHLIFADDISFVLIIQRSSKYSLIF